jgi:uncharacterized cupin superfamily protein
MLEERDGWFVVNVQGAKWWGNSSFGKICSFEMRGKFEQTGIHLALLEPGKPACRYHREDAQEDFLVLSGECLLLVNGEERPLKAWDFVHCPPGVSHVFVGAGEGPCALLMIGNRSEKERLFYPRSELAARHGAEAPEPTADPKVAYSDVPEREDVDPPAWPVG